uniref:RNA/RNP complex-1-interacting phosphatase n=1 Tax=Sphenodon punctatus TaxID=8508 RepID=A0A8D0HD98_SPHPU
MENRPAPHIEFFRPGRSGTIQEQYHPLRLSPTTESSTTHEQWYQMQPRDLIGSTGSNNPDSAHGRGHLPMWTDYTPLGQRMPGTRFIAFKVPLKKSFECRLDPNERFSPLDLIERIRDQKEELGMIIDLTYTTRYYGAEELPDTLCYCKILTVGHEVPDHETIFKFKSAVKKFLKENQDNDKLIGVHCTHVILKWNSWHWDGLGGGILLAPGDEGLFNKCRGHSMERKNYIEDLQEGPMGR